MSLTNYLIRHNLDEASLQRIIREADKGSTLEEIQSSASVDLSKSQIYAILCRYCQEGGGGSISAQYPEIYESFEEEKSGKEDEIIRRKVISKNKKALIDTYEDLSFVSTELSDGS